MHKKILVYLIMMLLMTAGITFVSGNVIGDNILNQPLVDLEYGDAPEGPTAIAYPSTGTLGSFPTCVSTGPAGWIQHNNFGAWFGPAFDFEPDGNGGWCPVGSFPPYDQDECCHDGDAGLMIPHAYTINNLGVVVSCPGCTGSALGVTGQTAVWGFNVDIDVHNHMPSATIGYVNVLMDFNQNGMWGDAGEHVLVNFQVPNPYDGPLSVLGPPSFTIGPNPGYVWTRFSITEVPVPSNWDGQGAYEDGESEDYLLQIIQGQNNPPLTPSIPLGPTSGVVGVPLTYKTSTTDPDGDNVRYGWDGNGDGLVDLWTGYYPSGATCTVILLFYSPGTYSISVIAEDTFGAQSGWSPILTVTITSGANNAPLTPSTPSGPTSGSTGNTYSFSTSTTDPDGDNLKYGWDFNGDGTVDIWDDNGGYYYTSGAPISTSYSWSTPGSYNVQVKAEDNLGAQSVFSPVLTVVITANTAPSIPVVAGPPSGKVGIAYTFSATSTDAEGDQIYYWFDWGDGTNTGWIGPYMSGMTANTAHTWSTKATYIVQVKAKDDPAALESGWGSISIRIPKSHMIQLPLIQFLRDFLQDHHNMFPLLQQLLGI
jgi:hypothetical protein